MIQSLKAQGITVEEAVLTLNDIKEMDECFTSSSTKELVPIIAIDDFQFGDTPGEGYLLARKNLRKSFVIRELRKIIWILIYE